MKANYMIYSSIARPKIVPKDYILTVVSKHAKVPVKSLQYKGRKNEVAIAKHIARVMMKRYTKMSLLSIAYATGATDHSSTISSIDTHGDLFDTDKIFRTLSNTIEESVALMLKPKQKTL